MIQCEAITNWKEKKLEVYKRAYERLCKRLVQEDFEQILAEKREEIQKFIFLYFKVRKSLDVDSMDLQGAGNSFFFILWVRDTLIFNN